MSTVDSGAATMKMINSTSITSMKGVTLISWFSLRSSPPLSRPPAICLRSLCCLGRRNLDAAIEIARHQPKHLSRNIRDGRPVGRDRARKLVVDDDSRNGRDEADGGREQR